VTKLAVVVTQNHLTPPRDRWRATWADSELPALPGEEAEAGLGLGSGGITVLSDGTLLATGGNSNAWELLRPGATSLCVARDCPKRPFTR
jgi:hypothetical protein